MSIVYRVRHESRFSYNDTVTHGYSEARLLPRPTPHQRVRSAALEVDPTPDDRAERVDFFGNPVVYFGLARPHEALVVTATSEVEVEAPPPCPAAKAPWEDARAAAGAGEVSQFAIESPAVEVTKPAARYARPSFPAGRPLIEAAAELTERIHQDFEYSPGTTKVRTPVSEILGRRRGVCQDFAHLEIACLRSLGLAARYVSGYLGAGVGARSSHAWCALALPDGSWLDLDPTNRLVAPPAHVTLAWGRDYSDVAPLKGVVFTEADHKLAVSVTVRQLARRPRGSTPGGAPSG
jgi:transglutaminase-like putative cysteine protease